MSRRGNGEGTIRQRPDGRWEYRYSAGRDPKTGKQIQRSVYAKTRGELEVKKHGIQAELDRAGKVIVPSKLTVESWLDLWLSEYCPGISDTTKKKYASDVKNRILPYLGAARLRDLTHADVQKWINDISKEISSKSVKNVYGTFHKAMQKAENLDLIKVNPCENVELPKVIKEPPKTLPETAVKSFLWALEGDFYRIPILFALYTGCRQMEILGLTWDNVNFSSCTVTIRQQLRREHGDVSLIPPKYDRTRTVPLTPQAVAILKEQRELQKKWAAESYGVFDNPLNLVFTNEIGAALVALSVRKHCKKAFEEIGLPDLRFHDLRHSYAVYMIRAGVDYKTISDNMGHFSVAFTMDTYAATTKEMEKESAARLGNFFDSLSG